MKRIYYYLHKDFQSGDLKKVWNFALSLIKKKKNVDTLTFLVYSSQQFSFLNELNITPQQCRKHFIPNSLGIKIQVHSHHNS